MSAVTRNATNGGLRYRAVLDALMSLRREPTFEELHPTESAVVYRTVPARGIAPLVDVYRPATSTATARAASVVLVHGGGFLIGSRRMKPMRYLATSLAGSGIAVCAIDYRLIFRGGRLDEALADIRDALAFWRSGAAGRGLIGVSSSRDRSS